MSIEERPESHPDVLARSARGSAHSSVSDRPSTFPKGPDVALVAGGAGFLGATLCRMLLERQATVICVDNLSTGLANNVNALRENTRFRFIDLDVTYDLDAQPALDDALSAHPPTKIFNLASPASPPAYQRLAIETLHAGSIGTENLLRLAERFGARFLQASTSEVYGDPAIHPQHERYWGNVNPYGPRSMYDESKRYAEALCWAYEKHRSLDVRIARIFNTYGPYMRLDDGRVITNFMRQALRGEPLTVYGDGSQTRSFCYVDDLVLGLLALIDSQQHGPVNLGNPNEISILDLVREVLAATESNSRIERGSLPVDDPRKRQPDIAVARECLGWVPSIELADGLRRTANWLRGNET